MSKYAKKSLFFSLLFFMGGAFSALSALAAVQVSQRDLIAVISVSHFGSSALGMFFKAEEKKALKRTLDYATGNYRNVKIFYREEATLQNFLNAIQESELDPAVTDIDAVVYLHGDVGIMGFVDEPNFVASEEVAKKILALKANGHSPTKLRALYSDACFGDTHSADLIHAGFRVVAGGAGTDTNKSADYGRFMEQWTAGESFRASIQYANEAWITSVSDRLEGGDSDKIVTGNGNLSIDE